jgi:outer membrane lipoprotein-sorting protein
MHQATRHRLTGLVTILTIFLSVGWADKGTGQGRQAPEVTSVTAEFTQEKHMRILSHPLVSKGVLSYQAPGSLRWEYCSPIRSILLMHEGRTRRYLQGKDGLTEDTGANLQSLQFVLPQMTAWLAGRFDEKGSFSAVFEGERRLVLTPTQESIARMISRIEIVLSSRPGLIDSVTIYESEDSFTRLTFQNAVLNQKIAASRFTEE